MGADQCDVDASSDQRFERGIGRRPAEAIETPALQIRDTRCELKAEQRTQGEDMVGITTAIGVVTGGRDITLMIKQPVEDVHGFSLQSPRSPWCGTARIGRTSGCRI